MEVAEFYRNVHRLCDSCGDCLSCPLYDNHCAMDQWGKMSRDPKYLDRVVEMVKDWAAEHPALTNRDVLVKIFGKDFSESAHPGALAFHAQDCADDDCKEWLNAEYTGPFKLLL